jgi:hypothetical protein
MVTSVASSRPTIRRGSAQLRRALPGSLHGGRSSRTKVAILSTESITSQSSSADAAAVCGGCGAPLAGDQRYCLECGERRVPMSSVLAGGPPTRSPAGASDRPPTPPGPPQSPRQGPLETAWQRNPALTVIAGIGVLLLAMGVGVLIGRSGSSGQKAAAPEVVTVAGAGTGAGAGGGSGAASETFTGDWPAGTRGYTVQLQTLPAGTAPSAVQAAKTAATAKGAKSVGALKSEEFSSVKSSGFVVYSGVYHKRSEAEKALAGLKKSFPAATVIDVSNGASRAAASGSTSGGGSTPTTPSSLTHPAPPSTLEGLKSVKGKNYEERSKNLPNVVSTG